MSGSLTHSPADIVRKLLIDKSLGATPAEGAVWPVYATREPDSPDSTITVYDTAGRLDGRVMVSGQVQEHPGIQIRVRDADSAAGFKKAKAVATALSEDVLRTMVTIGANTYEVQAISRTSGVFALGKETLTSKRNVFTINATVSLWEIV